MNTVQLPCKTATGHVYHAASGHEKTTLCGREWTQYAEDYMGVGCRVCNRALTHENRKRIESAQLAENQRRKDMGYL